MIPPEVIAVIGQIVAHGWPVLVLVQNYVLWNENKRLVSLLLEMQARNDDLTRATLERVAKLTPPPKRGE